MALDPAASQGPRPSREDLAPALKLLHARHDRRGYLTEEDIAELAAAIGVSPTELYGAITAYPRFHLLPRVGSSVCTGPVCVAQGARAITDALDATESACLGLCDQPVAVLTDEGARVARLAAPDSLAAPHAPPATLGIPVSAFFGDDDPLDAVEAALGMSPAEIIATVSESGLRGRGGAGFPAGAKWRAVADAAGARKVLICNADESEPGTFKDRYLLDHQPLRVLAGMIIAGRAIGADCTIVYLRYEFQRQRETLSDAIDTLRRRGQLGTDFDVVIRVGAGAYVCGEETALLNSLEGRKPIPRERPPYPTTHGLFGWPTLIHNVETLSAVSAIIRRGASWYRDAGWPKLYCVSGDVAAPGVFELPMTVSARELIAYAGCDASEVKAFTLGGLSGGLLGPEDLDVRLDFDSVRKRGAFLGSGGLIVLGPSRCLVRFARGAIRFFADESCGRCFPCRIGCQRLRERLDAATRFESIDSREMTDLVEILERGSACGLGVAAGLVAEHLISRFADELSAHSNGTCVAGECTRE